MDILTSMHGRRFGLGRLRNPPSGVLKEFNTGEAYGGPVVGLADGQEFITAPSPRDIMWFEDDFIGKTIGNAWDTQKGSDAACVNFAVNAQLGGVVRGTTGANAGVSMATNGVQLDLSLNWQANKGFLVMEASVKPSAITTICIFVGFTNQVASLQMPFTISGASVTANAADAVGFSFDTAATAATIKLLGVNNSGTAQQQDTGLAPSTSAFHTYRVAVDVSGNALFYRNGVQVGSQMASALRATVPLTPCIAAFTRAAGSANIDCDYIYAVCGR